MLSLPVRRIVVTGVCALTLLVGARAAQSAGQDRAPHGRLFPPEDLGLLEGPDRDAWQQPELIMDLLGIESSSFGDKDTVRRLGERFIAGWGGYPLVGTPEQVVEKMQSIHNMGIEGLILSWLDYHEELQYFGERVMPLLRQAGLRQ